LRVSNRIFELGFKGDIENSTNIKEEEKGKSYLLSNRSGCLPQHVAEDEG
jgi:hypothetical protein